MLVCLCKAVPESTIRRCMEAGAHSVEAITRECGAGGDCGSCVETIAEMLVGRGTADLGRPRQEVYAPPVFAMT